MAKKKKNENLLRVRKKFENLAFIGTSGKYQYDEPKLLKDFSIEELSAMMKQAALELDFEKAAMLRDIIRDIETS